MPALFFMDSMSVLGIELDVRSALAALVSALIVQAVYGIIWLTHLSDDVKNLQAAQVELKAADFVTNDKIMHLDIEGTRALSIVKDRQDGVLRRVEGLEERERAREDKRKTELQFSR